jgi:SPP1 family predicted phage head-tail adaptor
VSKYVQAQKLNRRITVQRLVPGRDAEGQPNDTWVTHCKLWADINTVSGSAFVNQEFYVADREVSRPTASVRVRRRTDLVPDMRILLGTTVYDIRVILPDLQDNRFMDIGVTTGANRG